MASVDLTRCCFDAINRIRDQLKDAILYLDVGCLEAFQYLGAFPLLLEIGVHAVCSLENMSSLDIVDNFSTLDDPCRKMVVITSRLLSDSHRYILRCLNAHQSFLSCTIYTSISEVAHSACVDSPLGPDAFHEYKSLLLQDFQEIIKNNKEKRSFEETHQERTLHEEKRWSQLDSNEEHVLIPDGGFTEHSDIDLRRSSKENMELILSVNHFPLIICPLSPTVFVLPSEATLSEKCLSYNDEDSLSPGLPPITTSMTSDNEDIPPGAILTAHFLYHLISEMDLKMEVFSLGCLSRTIGKILMDMSSLYDVGRRNKRSVGLLLIDRTLDLITPCCHGDSLFDRMLSSLPRRERTHFLAQEKVSHAVKHKSLLNVLRSPLDIKIPIGTIKGNDYLGINLQLEESIQAFLSGWNMGNASSQASGSIDCSSIAPHRESVLTKCDLLNGSFISTGNHQKVNYFEAIFDRKTKEAAVLIKKWLQEAIHREKITPASRIHSGSVNSLELYSMVKLLASNQASFVRNKEIINLGVSTAIALDESHSSLWDAFSNAEKILKISSIDSSQSLSSQICDILRKSVRVKNASSSRGPFSFKDALILSILGYIVAGENFGSSGSSGPFSWEEEHGLKETIMDAVIENPELAKFRFVHDLEEILQQNLKENESKQSIKLDSDQLKINDLADEWGGWEDDDINNNDVYDNMQLKLELRDRVDNLFKVFHKLSNLKRRNPLLRDEQSFPERNSALDMYDNKGLLYKILIMLIMKLDIPEIEYHSSAVGRLFKTGFGRFGIGQAKPRLGEQNILLIFVVGGINGLEVHEVREAAYASGKLDFELIIGGTTLLTPNDMFDLLLGSCSYI